MQHTLNQQSSDESLTNQYASSSQHASSSQLALSEKTTIEDEGKGQQSQRLLLYTASKQSQGQDTMDLEAVCEA
eukprot:240978-Ditylum_brightwellii.AAC.1